MTTTPPPSYAVGCWAYSQVHGECVRILDVESVWGHTVYQVWIPRLSAVERVPAESLSPAQPTKATGLDRIAYAVAAARIADALTQDVLLAPLEAGVIPLPHQLYALNRAVTGDRVRYLLADEVGLGKTIEAGLIFRELKLRGLVKRVLVVAPKGLVTQWVQEMQTHFGEEFRLLTPSEFSLWRNFTGSENVWRHFDQVVCPVDSIKPVERRRGWSKEKLEAYNQERLGDLIDAGWDLIIADEAHRLGGSTEQVARYRLGKALAEAAPYLLLLSATPHQGKTDGFQRLMALLDRDEFIPAGSIRKEKVVPFVIRTEKRRAINEKGDPLFMPRLTKLTPVRWEEKHKLQQHLYESVTEYVRLGYNQAMRQNRQYLGFLMILMQRLVTSSTQAIASALERRLEVLQSTNLTATDEEPPEDNIEEQDSQEQLEELLATRLAGLQNEKEEVKLLLDLARRCQAQGPDARAETLLNILYENQREENNSELKYLIFTEFVPTQNMLRDFLEQHGFPVVCLNGSMDLEERRQHEQAPDAVDDRRNAGQEFDCDTDGTAQVLRAKFGEENRDPKSNRNRDQHGNDRSDDSAVNRRERPETLLHRVPFFGPDEADAEVIERGQRTFDQREYHAKQNEQHEGGRGARQQLEELVAEDEALLRIAPRIAGLFTRPCFRRIERQLNHLCPSRPSNRT